MEIRVGSATVYALNDGMGTFFMSRADGFPAVSEAQWERADWFDPGAKSADGEWQLQFRMFAVRLDDGQVILVDAGIGPVDAPASAWAPTPGKLPEELKRVGIDPAEISQVVITHLHSDHIGWTLGGLFPNAATLVQRCELDWIDQGLRELLPHDQLVLLDGDSKLASEVEIVATPGHTPGHQSVLIDDGSQLVACTGDLLVHAIQLTEPDSWYVHEMDPEQALLTRRAFLNRVSEKDGLLATPHLTEPFVRAKQWQ